MRLVSINSEEDFAKQRALDDIRWPMKELAANMVRVVRGAGRAYDLPRQMVEVIRRVEDYHAAVGCYPSDLEISEMVSLRHIEKTGKDELSAGINKTVQGALQYAASAVVSQATQQSNGENELFEGLRWIEQGRKRLQKPHSRNDEWADDDI